MLDEAVDLTEIRRLFNREQSGGHAGHANSQAFNHINMILLTYPRYRH
jgi:hypothetical protein